MRPWFLIPVSYFLFIQFPIPNPLTYFFRRRLTLAEQWPAVGAGVAVGAAAFYIARLLLQRAPLRSDDRIAVLGRGDEVYHRPRRERLPP